MSKFGTDFSGVTIGSTLAGNGWTRKWTASSNFNGTIVAEGSGDNDRVAEFVSGASNSRNAMTWDAGGNRQFGEAFFRWRQTSNDQSGAFSFAQSATFRASGDGSSETGIVVFLSAAQDAIRVGNYDDASFSAESDVAFASALGQWVNILITATDSAGTATVKTWTGDRVTDEGTAVVETVNMTNTTSGGVGVSAFRNDYVQQFAFVGVADSGEDAPRSMADLSADTTPPTFNSAPAVTATGVSGHTIEATLSEQGTIYGVRLANGASAPDSAQVKAGNDASGSVAPEAQSVSAANDGSLVFSSGSANTPYDYYVVAEDDEGTPNVQASPTLVEATTDATLFAPINLGTTNVLSTSARLNWEQG